jgi:hypothetical protein
MNDTFHKLSKYYFWIAGLITICGSITTALSPISGFKLALNLSYFESSPHLMPIIGHWGVMVLGIGILLFLSGKNKKLRKSTAVFSTLEKGYLVCFSIYWVITQSPNAGSYILPIFMDGFIALGGIWYLWRSIKLMTD